MKNNHGSMRVWVGFRWSLLALLSSVSMFVTPAGGAPYGPDGKAVDYRQPDGATVKVKVFGDEFYAVAETLDGYTVVYDKHKVLNYGALSADGREIVPTGIRAGNKPDQAALQAAGIKKNIRLSPQARSAAVTRGLQRMRADSKGRVTQESLAYYSGEFSGASTPLYASPSSESELPPPPSYAPPTETRVGPYIGLCLLVDFSDQEGTIPRSAVDDYCNKPGYTNYSNAGSIYDYFFKQSGGRLQYNNIVTAYVRVSQPKTYYDDGVDGTWGNSKAQDLVVEALDILMAQGFDFTQLSRDSGDVIYSINVFYAGTCASGWSTGLWPHSWAIPTKTVDAANGIKAYSYQITDMGTALDIGTFCHENGHMLMDYPDLYSYDGNAASIGTFSLMASSGSTHPVNIDPYLKEASGWMDIIDLNSSSHQRCTVQVDGNQLYRYLNPAKPTEYFVFEVRDNTGYEGPYGGASGSVNPSAGLVAYHVYETGDNTHSSIWTSSNPASMYTKPYELLLVEANQETTITPWYDAPTPDSSDAFKSSGKSELSDSTDPALKFWDATGRNTDSGCVIHSISADGPSMTFVIGAGDPPGAPSIVLSRTTIDSFCDFGGAALSQIFAIANGGGGTLSYAISDNQSWLSCTPASGTASNESDTITVNFVTSNLVAGSYSATINVNDPLATPTNDTIIINLTVNPQPILSLSTTNIVENGIAGEAGPQVSFAINNAGGGAMTYSVSKTQSWLTLAPTSGTVVAETDTVYVDLSAVTLAPGTYNDTITITAPGASNAVQTIAVTFSVNDDDIIVTTPNGGETFIPGTQSNITWGSGIGGNVSIHLIKNGALDSVIISSTTNDGSYAWNVPESKTGSDFRVRLTSLDSNPGFFDDSNADFAIQRPELLISPTNRAYTNTAFSGQVIDVTANVAWAASKTSSWITITGGTNGVGNGTVTYSITTNSGVARSGNITVSGGGITRTFTVNQTAATGYVLAWGLNGLGQCNVPAEALSGVSSIAAGNGHTVALKNGKVLAWGDNDSGQCNVPAEALSGVSAIAAGCVHTVALKDGKVLAWGTNVYDQCNVNVPAEAQSGVSAIAAGYGHTVALKDGRVLAWGWNVFDQCNVPAEAQSGVSAIAAGFGHTVAIKNGKVLTWGTDDYGPVPTEALSGVSAIAAGFGFTVALKNGKVLAWGDNNYGRCNVPAEAQSGVSAIAAVFAHTVALKNGKVLAWGDNDYGQCNVPAEAQSGVSVIAAGIGFTVALLGPPVLLPALSVAPVNQPVTSAAGATTFTVANTGSGTMAYTTSESESWLSITGGVTGGNSGTITVSYDANPGSGREGIVTVTAPGASGSPIQVRVTQAAKTYTVSYSPNAATSGTAPTSQTKTNGVALTLRGNSGNLVRTGYTFAGWNTQTNGSGTDYPAGGPYTANATLTLYAKWTVNQYTLTFDSAGGSSVSPITQAYGSSVVAPSNPRRTSYTFTGWNPSVPATMPAGNLNLTAQWVLNELFISPTNRTYTSTAFSGQSITVTANVAWAASETSAWITITGGTNGVGNGTVTYSIISNPGTARSGNITVSGGGITRKVVISQAAKVNSVEVSPASRSHSNTAASRQTVSVTANVPWTATKTNAWITITGGASGVNNGTVTYSVSANGGAARSGRITVSGGGVSRYFTVSQAAASSLGIAPSSRIHRTSVAVTGQVISVQANIPWTATASTNWITITRGASGVTNGSVTYGLATNGASVRYGYITVGGGGISKRFHINQNGARMPVLNDFDRDGKSDLGYYRPTGGLWRFKLSGGGTRTNSFGYAGTTPITGDFDGDGITDYGCYDPNGIPGTSVKPGSWNIKLSSSPSRKAEFGYPGTIPIVGDFDGDGKADFGCYDPPIGAWYIMQGSRGFRTASFGYRGTLPIVGDFDGDGISDFGCYDPNGITGTAVKPGSWYIMQSSQGFRQPNPFGYPGTIPIVGDFDGDRVADYGCYDAAIGGWYIMHSKIGFRQPNPFGYRGTVPVVGDYDGDKKSDFGCYDANGIPGNVDPGTWFIMRSRAGFIRTVWGTGGSISLGK